MKLLITLFGWVPGLGQTLKLAYVAKCANDALSNVKMADAEQQENSANYVEELAEELYEEHVSPEVESLDMPSMVNDMAKNKAIGILTDGIKKKMLSN